MRGKGKGFMIGLEILGWRWDGMDGFEMDA
jgi:hypothetical protein